MSQSSGVHVASAVPADAIQRRAIAAIVTVLLTFAAFWPSTLSLMEKWEDTVARTYTHGYVVFALGLWMFWRDRARWAVGAAKPFPPAIALLVFGAFCWLIAYRAGLQIVHQAALPALAASALLAIFGWRMLRGMAFPLAWFYLAIPVWDAVLPLLNAISVGAVRLMLRIADVPAYFVNNTFELPLGTFAIADGCSGVHFFVVGLTISLLYGEINRDNLRTRIKLVAFALLLAMATNWLRIFIIVMAGHLTDMQHSLVVDEHYSFGWYMFAGMMVLYFLVVRRWPAASEAPIVQAEPAGEPIPRRPAIAAAIGLAIVPLWLYFDANRATDAQLARAMHEDAGFTPSAAPSDWQPKFHGATRELHGFVRGADVPIEAYLVGFAAQRQGEEIVGFRNSLLGEELRAQRRTQVAPAPWREIRAAGPTDNWVIWYSYRLEERGYRSPLRLQLEYGWRSLFGAPAAALIALRARCATTDCDAARESLQHIVETRYP
jgi:exosortase A